MISVAQLRAFAPHCDAEAWAPALSIACERFSVTTPKRIEQFMAQTGEETGGYVRFEENLGYSAEELFKQWPVHFPTLEFAAGYAHQPERIANRAYALRYGNGDEASGDGWRFRGRGPIQTTFRDGYQAAAKATGLDCVNDPDLLLQPDPGSMATAAYWHAAGCNELADAGDIVAITRKVNGGLINLDHREAELTAWRKAVAAAPAVVVLAPPAPAVVAAAPMPIVAADLPRLGPIEVPHLEIPPPPPKTAPAPIAEYALASVVIAMIAGAALWIWTLLRKPKRGVAKVQTPVMQPGPAPKETTMNFVQTLQSAAATVIADVKAGLSFLQKEGSALIGWVDASIPGAQVAMANFVKAADADAAVLAQYAGTGLNDAIAALVPDLETTIANLISASGLVPKASTGATALDALDVTGVTTLQTIAQAAVSSALATVLSKLAPTPVVVSTPTPTPTPAA